MADPFEAALGIAAAEEEKRLRATQPPAANDFDVRLESAAKAYKTDIESRVRSTLRQSVGLKPDVVANQRRLAQETGLPEPTVERNEEDVAKEAYAERLFETVRKSPSLMERFADPRFAAVAHDDAEQLGLIEGAINGLQRSWRTLLQGPQVTAAKANSRIIATIDQVEQLLAGGATPESITDRQDPFGVRWLSADKRALMRESSTGLREEQVRNVTMLELEKRDIKTDPTVAAAMQAKTFDEFWKHFSSAPLKFITTVGADSAISSLPGLVAAIPAGMVGGVPAAMAAAGGGSFFTDFSSSFIEALRDEGVNIADQAALTKALSDPRAVERAGRRAFAHAAPVALLDGMSAGLAGRTLAPVTLGPWKRQAVNVAVQAPAQGVLGGVGEAAGSFAAGQEIKAGDVMAEFFGELVGTPGEVASLTFARARSGYEAARLAEVQANALAELQKIASASKLLERDPQSFRDFVNTAAEGGPLEAVWIRARDLMQVLEQSGTDATVLPQEVREQIADAVVSDSDVRIPTADLLTADSALSQAALPFLKSSPGAMSQEEARVFMQEQAGKLREDAEKLLAKVSQDAATKTEVEQVRQQFVQQLEGAKRWTKDVNEAYAAITTAFVTTMAPRVKNEQFPNGMTPTQFVQKYQLNVAGQSPLAAGRNVMDQPATQQDFRPGAVSNLLGKSNWSILTAENPNAVKLDPTANAARNAQLEAYLKEQGIGYEPVKGKYGAEENSFIIFGVTPQQALEVGRLFGQESVLTPQGLVYQDGTVNPATGVVEHSQAPEDFYTMVPSSGAMFSVDINWDQRVPLEEAQRAYAQAARARPIPAEVGAVADIVNARKIASGRVFGTNRDFKVALQDAVRQAAAAAGVDLTQDTPAVREYLKQQILAEARRALQENENAVGWYDDKLTAALEVLSVLHPELATDPQARFAFIWALAVTSNGLRVDKNFELAETAYEAWKKSGGPNGGRFPTRIGQGTAAGQINNALELYNRYIGEWGFEKFHQVVTTKQPNKDLKGHFGRAASGEGMDTLVYGAAIVGPKIGNGFFANLYGHYEQLTMDRWWVRMWGRLTGGLIDVSRQQVADQRRAFGEIVEFIRNDPVAKAEVEDILGRKLTKGDPLGLAQHIVAKTTKESVRQRLKAVLPVTEERTAAMTKIRGRLKDFASVADELRKMAKTYVGTVDGQVETPANTSQRNFMRAVSGEVLAELQKDYPALTMADFQALLWYPEKTLYDSAGVKEDEGETGYDDAEAPDYANAAVKLARDKGVSNEQIEAALQRARSAVSERRSSTSGRGYGELRGSEGGAGASQADGLAGAPAGTAGARGDQFAAAQPGAGSDAAGGGLHGGVLPQYGQGPEGSLEAVGVHFSTEQRSSLDSSKFGAGLKGAEHERVAKSTDPRLKHRVYFYVPEGQGVTPERGVGAVAHGVVLGGLYDLNADPLKLALRNPGDGNALETAVLNAGFSGVYRRGFANGQGVAILLGPNQVPVAPLGDEGAANDAVGGTTTPPPQLTAERQLADSILQAQGLPGGAVPGGQWLEALDRAGVQLPEDVRTKIAAANEPLYRDQMVRTFYNQEGQALPTTIEVDGKQRPTVNSEGRRIAATEEGVRNFWRWFGDSKVVDAQGRPLVVYHGTASGHETFDVRRLGQFFDNPVSRTGFFFAEEKHVAEEFANYAEEAFEVRTGEKSVGPRVIAAYLKLVNPVAVDGSQFNGANRDDTAVLAAEIEQAKRTGHDGAIIGGWQDGSGAETQYIAFRPEQIKSAIGNDGTFDANDPSILSQGTTARGQISFAPDITQSPSTITLLKNADLSTFLHELGHFQLEVLAHVASQPDAPAEIVQDMNVLLEWFGIKGGAQGGWVNGGPGDTVAYHGTSSTSLASIKTNGLRVGPHTGNAVVFVTQDPGQAASYAKKAAEATGGEPVVLTVRIPATDKESVTLRPHAPVRIDGRYSHDTHVLELSIPIPPERITEGVRELSALEVWNAMSLEQKRPYHEQFARGFEAYLFEGKAPNVEMQGIFQRFAAWLKQVYKDIKALAVELTPEVRGVMDRMLASEEAIQSAEDARGFAPLFEQKPDGMTDEEWRAYQELHAGATAEATEELQRRSLRDMQWLTNARGRALAKLQKDAKEKRAAVEAEVRAEVEKEPAYAVQLFIKKGVLPDGTQAVGAKLQMKALKEMYGEGPAARWRYLATNLVSADVDGSLTPDTMAEMFGFRSGDHLVNEILNAAPIEQVVEALTDQRMLERYGDISDETALERAADEAVHNEARARFIATELAMLAKATGKPKTLAAAAKAFAEQIIGRKKINDIRPHQYVAAEARAARAAAAALQPKAASGGGKEGPRTDPGRRTGNLTEAATEKRNQLINHYAARAASEGREYVEKWTRRLTKIATNEGTRKNIDPEYLDQIDAILEKYDLRAASQRELQKRASLREWVEKQRAMGLEPEIDEALLDSAEKIHYSTLTLDEFKAMVDGIRNIEHLGRLKKKLLTARDEKEFAAVVEELSTSIADNATGTVKERWSSDRGPLVSLGDIFRRFMAEHRKFASLAREMDGWQDGGKMWERLVRTMNDAGNFEAVEREKATIALGKLLMPVEKGLGKKVDVPAVGRSFTREELLGIALNMGNEVNRERVMSGEKWTTEQLKAVLDPLTAQDWQFVQGVWDYLDTFRPLIGAKQKRVTGIEPDWVEAAPVQTKFGLLRGGYYPIKYDPKRSTRAEADTAAEVQRQIERGLYARAQTRRGHIKERTETTGRPLRYDLSVVTQHVDQVIHDLAWHEFLIDANRLLNAKAIDSAIREHYGPEKLGTMRDLLRDIAVGDLGAQSAGDRVLNHLRHGATIAGLGWNLGTSLLQPIGMTQSIVRIGAGNMLRGIRHWAGDLASFESSYEKVAAKSEFMRLRGKTMQREINEIRNKVSGGDSRLEASYFYLIQKMQLVVDIPTWWGAYEGAMRQPDMDESRAVALADQAVIDAQGAGQIKDLAQVQRGSPAWRLFTNFYSFFNTTYNLTREAVGRTRSAADVPGLVVDLALLYTIPALMGTILKAGLSGDWDDEDKLLRRLVADQLNYLLGTVVVLRELGGAVQGAAGLKGADYSGPASVRFFSEVAKLAKQAEQGEADAAFWKALNSTAGILLHYPAGQINKTAEGIAQLASGETQNPIALVGGKQK